jgi:CRP-like cAMP-binding protein
MLIFVKKRFGGLMNTFEKMLFLKSMPLFKFIKDDVLMGLAPLLEEQVANSGELIIQKGDLGTTMYLIVTGKVKVHDGERLIKELGTHDVFGELAALCPEIRIASISTLEESCFLKVPHSVLDDLMEMEPSLAKGFIQVLCQRVRSISRDLEQLTHRD